MPNGEETNARLPVVMAALIGGAVGGAVGGYVGAQAGSDNDTPPSSSIQQEQPQAQSDRPA